MIERIVIKNFKAASDVNLRLCPLTLLTGLNSSGKSTVMQAMALLRQNRDARKSGELFSLVGPLVQLGMFSDIHTHGAESDSVDIEVRFSAGQLSVELSDVGRGNAVELRNVCGSWPPQLSSDEFQYLQADRIGPRNLFPRSALVDSTSGLLGAKGEFVAEKIFSEAIGGGIVSPLRRCPSSVGGDFASVIEKTAPTDALLDQVVGWLQQISPGVRLSAEEIVGTDEFKLQFGYAGRVGIGETSQKIRPINVGFGLTYILPIIVACLTAKPGSLLLIENPEAHLHPRGQSAIAELISRVVADGVQVLLETHSDHVLNGVRLSAKRGVLAPVSIAVHFFSRVVEDGAVSVESPALLEDGRLSNWPKGFFDQIDRDLDALLG